MNNGKKRYPGKETGIPCPEDASTGGSPAEELFGRHTGRYVLEKFVIGCSDLSEAYMKGGKDRSLYMIFEITSGGKCFLRAHSAMAGKKMSTFSIPPG